jgi:hypothetical protein
MTESLAADMMISCQFGSRRPCDRQSPAGSNRRDGVVLNLTRLGYIAPLLVAIRYQQSINSAENRAVATKAAGSPDPLS